MPLVEKRNSGSTGCFDHHPCFHEGIVLAVFSITFFQQFHTVIIIWKIQPPADRLSENLFSFFGIFYLIIMFRPVFEVIDLGGFFFFQKHREVLSLGVGVFAKLWQSCFKLFKTNKNIQDTLSLCVTRNGAKKLGTTCSCTYLLRTGGSPMSFMSFVDFSQFYLCFDEFRNYPL